MENKTIDQRISKIVDGFSQFHNWEDRYKYLIDYGKNLSPLADEFKQEVNLVKGCQSQVWLVGELVGNKVIFKADSDASIVKGIIALLVEVYSDSSPDEILNTKPDFIEKIGLAEHLSMSRANGLTSMIKQITIYAMAFKAKLSMMK
jgi:cysteine desulfuration protein SufE